MPFTPTLLRRPVRVDRVVTVHYFEYSSSYYFEGERHDFWEFLYVDKGEVYVLAEGREALLGRGSLIFHPPGEFHALRATGDSAPNLVVASFYCDCPELTRLCGRTFTAREAERALIGSMVSEAELAFVTPLDDPATTALERRAEPAFGSEQLIGAHIEELLIRLLRRGAEDRGGSEPVSAQSRSEIFTRVDEYLSSHLGQVLTIERVCRDNLVGRSRLQQVFHSETGGGVMEYFGKKKIEAAKEMIRRGSGNFTEIGESLGYQSIYYFSRHFKKVTGMSPSEYAAGVRALAAKTRPGD